MVASYNNFMFVRQRFQIATECQNLIEVTRPSEVSTVDVDVSIRHLRKAIMCVADSYDSQYFLSLHKIIYSDGCHLTAHFSTIDRPTSSS